jgi:acyl-CoA synthetase (AMP-forming)/AMP-acid ligase II
MMTNPTPEFFNLGSLVHPDRDPDKPAVIDLGGERPPREIPYRELDAMANGVASALTGRGFARGDRIAIVSANRVEFLAACFGIMRSRLVAVPVNVKFPRAAIDYVIRDAGARLAFCDAPRRKDCPVGLPLVEFGGSGGDSFDRFLGPPKFEVVRPREKETAMFLYTSGSTGKPKGVVLSHQSHLWVVKARLAGRNLSKHRMLVAAPLYHMNALALAQLACAAHATIVLMPQFSARAYIEAIGRYRCTWLTSVPPMMAMMLREKDLLERTDLASVEIIRMGSAPVSENLVANLRRYFPRASILNAYGTTEGGPVVFGPHPEGLGQPGLSVGYPHPEVRLRLVDAGGRNAVEGVLEMKCPAMMTGYHNLPEATARAFTEDGYYVTGDVFRRDADGFHYFVGRADDMFVCGGENVYPGEVEKMLETHPEIEQACVVAVPDEIKGTKPVAFVVLKPGAALGEAAIKQYALANAPAYQHPRRVWIVPELPLAGTNKVDRNAVMQMALARLERITAS